MELLSLTNAPYLSTKVKKFPTTTWNKDQLVEWLTNEGVTVDKWINNPKYDQIYHL